MAVSSELGEQTCAEDDYRALMGSFPTGVAVVTSTGADGFPRGLTCSSLTSVAVSPPTLLICLHTRSSTLEALCRSGRFAVNLLRAEGRRVAELFSRPVDDRFAHVTWAFSEANGQPVLVEDAVAFAGCRVTRSLLVGDHAVVLGEVTDVTRAAGVPLLYGLRRFAAWRPDQDG
ncbi:flavin reductase family protein [Nonomuraea basaltis]|uniref:flavin reductase family protein n=1 Tax=Nonomuraea basaltis TaxID=2495887 RepID=UPI00110C5F7C|nr:flavin reductase family protein [Nonomuraea basaltis]TMR99138.1 flavin reductase family protein [Nonomuraea basaltis]